MTVSFVMLTLERGPREWIGLIARIGAKNYILIVFIVTI